MTIKETVEAAIKKGESRNPFDLAQALGIIVLWEPLGEIQGYYNCCYRQKFIHINDTLEEHPAAFTCAHELGHAILHPHINTPFLRRSTLFSVDRLETEANRFAVDFLYEDEELFPYLSRSITEVADYMGVSLPLAKYRMGHVDIKL